MHTLVRKLLIFFVFIVLFASQTTLGADQYGSKYRENGGSHTQTLTVMQDDTPSKHLVMTLSEKSTVPLAQTSPSKAVEKIWGKEKKDWHWWEMPLLFVTTLFEPFIVDAPTVLEAINNEGDKLAKLGAKDYLKDTGKSIGKSIAKTAQEDPLEFTLNVVTQGGALALGYIGSDSAGLLPLAVATASGVKQSQLFFAAAHEIGSRTTVDKICRLGLLAGGVYLITSVPGAYALETLTLGTQYDVTTTTPGSVHCDIAPTSTDGTAFGVWIDSGFNVVGCNLTSSAAGTNFTLSASPTTSSSVPYVCCSKTNSLCLAAWQCGTDICVRPFNPITQALSPLTTANTITSSVVAGGDCTALPNGNLAMSWASFDPGSYRIWQRTFSGSTGLPLTSPLNVNVNLSTPQGENCIVSLPGSSNNALIGWAGGSSPNYIINSAIVDAAAGTLQSPAQTVSTSASQQQYISCFTSSTEGRLAWGRAGTIQVQRISSNGAPIGSSYTLPGTTGVVSLSNGVGTPDGNAFITVSQIPTTVYYTGYGGTFASDASGTPQSPFIPIPSNPNNNTQQLMCLTVLGGGNYSNYNVMALFDGAPITSAFSMQARSVNVQGGTLAPTSAPTSSASSLQPSYLVLVSIPFVTTLFGAMDGLLAQLFPWDR